MYRLLLVAILAALTAVPAIADPGRASPRPAATPASQLRVKKDFKVELLYSVPREKQGSWVSMCVDAKGRLIVSDQYGSLYRITPPALGGSPNATKVEKIKAPIGEAQGLLWAFNSLYVVVNQGRRYHSGLYRVRSSHGDDQLDKVELLRPIHGNGEHGPHAVILSPDRKSLYVVAGDGTSLVQPLSSSRVPRDWGEDHLLPRMPDGNGFMRDVLAPGGAVYHVDPDGKNWELVSTGYRNPYDIAFNRDGELFTFDADMEWDMNTPWYRPTRVCLITSGSEFGWRNGAGKWPPYYFDSLPAVFDVGPGSPTGLTFGYGAHFPARYQDAFFLCDWSYGKLYALHLSPAGSAYKGEIEEFVTGSPLPLTDIVVSPTDGAMYFTVGGRNTQSGLYRVTYVGHESTAPAPVDPRGADLRALRHRIEAYHTHQDPQAAATVWPYLSHHDRFIRFAARVALEHQDVNTWREHALAEKDPEAALNALLALVRVSSTDRFHRHPGSPVASPSLQRQILTSMDRLSWDRLTDNQRLELLRLYEVALNRMGMPPDKTVSRLIAHFDAVYPTHSRYQNAELCQLLVYLEAPNVVRKTLNLMEAAPTQEEQLEYARALRVLKTGWTISQREQYLAWYGRARHFTGGASLRGFLNIMMNDTLNTLSDTEKTRLLKWLLQSSAVPVATAGSSQPRAFVRQWKLDELMPLVSKQLKSRRDYDRGRRLFGEAKCYSCHRFANDGGSQGPDLTGVAGRFNLHDLLESIVLPSKTISDQYAAVIISTTEGKVVTGRIINLNGNEVMVNTNMLDPNAIVTVNRKRIESMEPSKVSMMPTGLLDTFKEDEIADLVAFLLSRGDRHNLLFR
ncbi:MAG TPA: c-type cytochrome [Gemmataceae bacterium]|nr:c-type cytochrome [Gemmataceae bacterium]